MADTFTNKFEKFLDNNQPGGYIQTTITINDDDLDARINQNINSRGFITSSAHLPWAQIDNKPTLFSGNYNDLRNKPTLFSGDYNDLSNKPTIFSGDYNDLLNKPTLFSGDYNDLSNKPTLFSGYYNDLLDKPNLDISITNTLNDGIRIATIEEQDIYIPPITSNLFGLAQVAITGDYQDLHNTFYSIDFSTFIYLYNENTDEWETINNTYEEYPVLQNCGFTNGYIRNIDQFYNNTDNNNNNNIPESILSLYNNFMNGQICYLKHTNNAYYLITQMIPAYNSTSEIQYLIITCTNYITTNYNVDFIENINQMDESLSKINFNQYQTIIIFDFNKNVLFSVYKPIYEYNQNTNNENE